VEGGVVNGLTDQTGASSGLIDQLRRTFSDEDYRNAYAESFSNSYVAGQIKVLREEYPMTQEELAKKIGTQQSGVARLENVNYSAWKVETLRRLARAFNVRLKITFEEWGTLPNEIEHFTKEGLMRLPFTKDPVFCPSAKLGSVEALERKQVEPGDDWVGISWQKRQGGIAIETKSCAAKAS
jgi:transcriptional regulator with XRE-family HTH domain